ncbi:MAG: sugar phosphate isomerase/epimerase [bacterium]|nr:sugar phosphate isomerase/epimerase [bacterium]
MSQNAATPRFSPPNRRQMLVRSSQAFLAAGAASCLSSSAWGKPADSNMQFGLVTYLWGKDMTLPELIDTCEQSGVRGVELRTEHKHAVEPSLSAAERDEVRKRFADSQVELIGYGSNCEYHSADVAQVRKNIEDTKRFVELMHDCGGTGVKVKPNGFAKGVPHEKTIEQIGKSLNEVAAFGEGYGQKIRVEVHGTGTSALPVIRDIFEVADHPNVYVCWNSNNEDLAGDGLEANFKMVQERFGDTVHVRELNLGDYPYEQLMRLFRGIDYAGWILLEARTDPQDKVAALVEQRLIFERLTAS